MGIITKCVQCEHCDEKYRLRFNIGNKYPQSATFPCHTCGEDLTFGMDEDESIFKNIKEVAFRMDLKIVNLHPELTLDAALKDDPLYFPSIDFMVRQQEQGEDGIFGFRSAQQSCILYQQKWDAIQTDFRYLREKRWKLLEDKYGTDQKETEHKILLAVFDAADHFLQGKWAEFSDNMLDIAGEAYNHLGYAGLRNYLLDFKEDFLMNKLYEVMKSYREVEDALLPTLLHQKCGFVPEGHSSAVNWEKLKMVYGDFFEIYGDLLLIPTSLNNLLTRNDFNKFNTDGFNLNKYIDADKSGKAENFKTNGNLVGLADFYDSGIRNGTHHQASTFDKDTQTITFRTGKGGRGRKDMSLVNYIEHCNELFARILAVLKSYYLINMMKPANPV
ncbi:hypothetical protein [Pedobacter nyackensis]|uniref:Uncharacterized protein n=1 Tax=Pedobacter nyackensis TaxID=475255 RepID=A0A1W2AIH0_9SPHI|nr:hypothetical protein [Pedobacter nyackensis]SMC60424.1 hypothetical protein SAMN04488101_101643 [Pedobacter nyackensis]